MRAEQDGVQVTRKQLDLGSLYVACCVKGTVRELRVRDHSWLLRFGRLEGGGNKGR